MRSDFELISDRRELIGGPAGAEGGQLGVGPHPNEPTSLVYHDDIRKHFKKISLLMIRDESSPVILRPNLSKSVRLDLSSFLIGGNT